VQGSRANSNRPSSGGSEVVTIMLQSATSSDSGRPDRETAKRAFAREFDDAVEIFQESDEDRAPKFALLPTGERANRLFVVGALTEIEDIGTDSEFLRGRVVGPTGTFFIYAGQYQPEAMEMLRSIETPEFVSVVGKPRTWERDTDDDDEEDGDEGGNLMTQLTPESVTVVDRATRDRWVIETAELTMERIVAFNEGEGEGEDDDIEHAIESYGEDIAPYREGAMNAAADLGGVEIEDEDEDEDEDKDKDEESDE
jgi:RPA family protein